MKFDDCLDGVRLQTIEFADNHCAISFDNQTGMTVYSAVTVNMIVSGEKPQFIELKVSDEFFEFKFTHQCSILVSRSPISGPEVFVYRAADGQYIVE